MRFSLYIRHPGFDAMAVSVGELGFLMQRAKDELKAGAVEVWARDHEPPFPAMPFMHYSLDDGGWLLPERCDLDGLHRLIH